MWRWLRNLRAPRRAPIDDLAWQSAVGRLRLLDARAPDDIARLRERVGEFLARRRITATHDLELSEEQRLIIAMQACLPFVHLPLDWLGHWHEVIVYPGQFRVRRRDHDEDTEVVTEWDDDLAGEAWEQGPIILSWADIEQDLAEPFEGFNVVLHEIAHKIDMADGASDGMPPLRDRARRARWREVMQACFDRLNAQIEAGEETVLDPYAGEAPEEFFAVVTEYYFSAPDVLAEHYPDVHAEFRAFYGEVPAPRVN